MKDKGLFVTLTLGLGLTLALLWILGSQSLSAVAASSTGHAKAPNAPTAELYVCPSGCAYSSVQVAVDAAGDGDVIKVAAGTYTDLHVRNGVTQVVYLSEAVTIQGGYTTSNWTTPDPEANPTTLDAQGRGRVLYIAHSAGQPVIEGLRITGGDAAGLGGGPPWAGDIGGGVYLETGAMATISDNWVFDNVADNGGGLWLRGSESVLSGNVIFSNTARWKGGGLFLELSHDTLSENIVISNTAGDSGGGLFLTDVPTLINNVFAGNQASGTGSGLAMGGPSPDCSPRLLHNTIARNHGGDSSGVGIVDFFGPSACTVALTNTILADQSVGVNIGSSGICTVTANGVLWHNVPITVLQSTTATVTVRNQRTGDPAFAPDGYHLTVASAAMDRGVDAGITVDIDGESRPAGAGYDLGADESWWHKVYLPLVIRNCTLEPVVFASELFSFPLAFDGPYAVGHPISYAPCYHYSPDSDLCEMTPDGWTGCFHAGDMYQLTTELSAPENIVVLSPVSGFIEGVTDIGSDGIVIRILTEYLHDGKPVRVDVAHPTRLYEGLAIGSPVVQGRPLAYQETLFFYGDPEQALDVGINLDPNSCAYPLDPSWDPHKWLDPYAFLVDDLGILVPAGYVDINDTGRRHCNLSGHIP